MIAENLASSEMAQNTTDLVDGIRHSESQVATPPITSVHD